MSDAQDRPAAEDTPSVEELERTAIPASVRRAPRFGRIVGTGAGIGAAAGLLCGWLLPNSTGVGRGMVGIVVGLGFALLGGLIAGLIATRLDRGTPARLEAMKRGEAQAAPASDHDQGTDDANPATASAPQGEENT